jgi:hypothetical protein
MANGSEEKDTGALKQKELEVRKDRTALTLLAGAEKYVGGGLTTHTGVSVYISSNRDELSTIMIPDLDKIVDGPVYITNPVRIKGDNLKKFLQSKGVKLPDNVEKFVADAEISCEAFYYTKSGPLLMVFALDLTKGLITDLVGKELGDLFDIHGASVRVLRCPDEGALQTLQKYCGSLSQ